jgi:small subunit ribosomal protein S5
VIDQKVKEPSTIPEKAKWLKDEQRASKVSKWLVEKNEEYQQSKATDPTAEFKPSRLDFMKFMEEASFMTGDGKRGSSVIAPALPKIPSMKGQYSSKEGSDPRDADGKWTRLMKQTGMTLDEIFGLKTKQLVTNFVTNQTRLGKIRRVYVLSIAGDGNGRLGIGEGKAIEPDEASNKALQMAIKNMRPIPRYEERTIFGEVEGKVAACEVTLMSRPPGEQLIPPAMTSH